MRKHFFIAAVVFGILLLALGGWTVKGIRRLGRGSSARASRPAQPAWAARPLALA